MRFLASTAMRRNSELVGQVIASLAITPRKSALLELIDEAIRLCREEARNSVGTERFNDFDEARSLMFDARNLIVGERG